MKERNLLNAEFVMPIFQQSKKWFRIYSELSKYKQKGVISNWHCLWCNRQIAIMAGVVRDLWWWGGLGGLRERLSSRERGELDVNINLSSQQLTNYAAALLSLEEDWFEI